MSGPHEIAGEAHAAAPEAVQREVRPPAVDQPRLPIEPDGHQFAMIAAGGLMGTPRDYGGGGGEAMAFSFRCSLSGDTLTIAPGYREVIGRAPELVAGQVLTLTAAGFIVCSWTRARGGTDDPTGEDVAGAWSSPFWAAAGASPIPASDEGTFRCRLARIDASGGVFSVTQLHLGDVVVHPMPPPSGTVFHVPRVNANGGYQNDWVRIHADAGD